VCERLAEFVAKNGRAFEEMTRARNPGDTPFKCARAQRRKRKP
jgi:splicing factor 4